mgnify:CR=1 FL=1
MLGLPGDVQPRGWTDTDIAQAPTGAGWIGTQVGVPLAALLFLLGVQIVTGACMALTYSPSPETAYDSVRYLEHLPNAPQDDRGLPDHLREGLGAKASVERRSGGQKGPGAERPAHRGGR